MKKRAENQFKRLGKGAQGPDDKEAQFIAEYDDCMADVLREIEARYHQRDRQRHYVAQVRSHMERYLGPKFRAKTQHFKQKVLGRNKTLIENFQYGLGNMALLSL